MMTADMVRMWQDVWAAADMHPADYIEVWRLPAGFVLEKYWIRMGKDASRVCTVV